MIDINSIENLAAVEPVHNRTYRNNNCSCGSGKPWFPLYDARGIYCQSVCSSCERSVMSKYRKEIFTDPYYDIDETIDDY